MESMQEALWAEKGLPPHVELATVCVLHVKVSVP